MDDALAMEVGDSTDEILHDECGFVEGKPSVGFEFRVHESPQGSAFEEFHCNEETCFGLEYMFELDDVRVELE